MLGVVACETLYEEIDRAPVDPAVEYVPQWLHEFPIHPPESSTIRRSIGDRIAALEARGVDEVLVLYHDPHGLEGLHTEGVPLHVHRGGDCIDLFIPERDPHSHGEWKAPSSYYLTRGWIDVGLDCYKVYTAYAGELDDLVETFRSARRRHPDLRVSWPDCDRIRRARARSGTMRTDPADLLASVVTCYQRVVLVDTGALLPLHYEYARSFRSFVGEMRARSGGRDDVELDTVEGDRSTLLALLEDPGAVADVSTYPPMTPVDPAEPSAPP